MNYKANYSFFNRLLLAIQGIFLAIKRERHMKIHLLFSLALLLPLIWIEVGVLNIWLLIILITLLIVTELINTAIEITIDMISKKFSYRAKLAKDISSGSVLIIASLVLMFGIYIYAPSFITISRSYLLGN